MTAARPRPDLAALRVGDPVLVLTVDGDVETPAAVETVTRAYAAPGRTLRTKPPDGAERSWSVVTGDEGGGWGRRIRALADGETADGWRARLRREREERLARQDAERTARDVGYAQKALDGAREDVRVREAALAEAEAAANAAQERWGKAKREKEASDGDQV